MIDSKSTPAPCVVKARPSFRTAWKSYFYAVVPAVVAFGLCLVYIFGVYGSYIDDAYIFFQYATNLSSGNGLSFNPGEMSFGITSILWTLLLAVFHYLTKLDIIYIAQVLGAILFSLSTVAWSDFTRRATGKTWLALLVGVLYGANPSAVKMSVSGMDVALSVLLLGLMLLTLQRHGFRRPLLVGALAGLAFLCRPDALLLMPMLLAYHGYCSWVAPSPDRSVRSYLKEMGWLLVGFAVLVTPWVAYVKVHTGDFIPPTRMGKLLFALPHWYGCSYPEFLSFGIAERLRLAVWSVTQIFRGSLLARVFWLPFMLPFAILLVIRLVGKRSSLRNMGLSEFTGLYIVAMFAMFALLFPITQSRYLAAVLPISIVGCIVLAHELLKERFAAWKVGQRLRGIVVPVLVLGAAVAYLAAHVYVYSDYRQAVQVQGIRAEVGRWLQQHTAPDASVALEPIGAVGYYSERHIVDMGGLIDDAVWPYIQDGYRSPERVFAFLRETQPTYIVVYVHHPGVGKVVDMFPEYFTLLETVVPLGTLEGKFAAYDAYSIYLCHWDLATKVAAP